MRQLNIEDVSLGIKRLLTFKLGNTNNNYVGLSAYHSGVQFEKLESILRASNLLLPVGSINIHSVKQVPEIGQ